MDIRKTFLLLCSTACTFGLHAANPCTPIYKNPDIPVEERIEDLLARMTLDEKILQLNQYALGYNNNANNIGESVKDIPAQIGSLIYLDQNPELRNGIQQKAMEQSRLGIPILCGYDVIHGFRTVYPISLAQACSWNPALVEQACGVAAREARMSGVDWTFSPMIDVARDGRWGRVAEGYGEDPYTNAIFCAASVEGYQGDDLTGNKRIAACLKHYVGYGASEAGRDYVQTDFSGQTLWDTYLPPYEAGIRAGAATVMSAFNTVNGIPASANRHTLTEILKERWQHDGFVVSDWNSVRQLIDQGVAADEKQAALAAFMAGVDMDMADDCYRKHLAALVAEGKVPMARIDDAVRRILRLKFRLGLFERPYTEVTRPGERFLQPESLRIAEQLAEESIVLLKNADEILPLEGVKKIALVGPMAQDRENLLGSWAAHGRAEDVCSIYDAMAAEFAGAAEVVYARGCDFEGSDSTQFRQALDAARDADVVVCCLGEKRGWSGENASRSTLALPQIQEDLVSALHRTGKPVIVLLSNGRPLELTRIEKHAEALLEMWQPGVAGGKGVAGMLSGRLTPSGKLCITFPYSTGQIPIYYNRRKSARQGSQGLYQDIPSTPLYEFGYGLSYTDFEYGTMHAPATSIKRSDKLTIELPVTNTGSRPGQETVLWFVSDPVCRIARPVKELRHFEKKFIKNGETTTYLFHLDPMRDLAYTDDRGNRFLEAGDYYIVVGDQRLKIELVN